METLRDEALRYYDQGYGCSQCILKAAGDYYRIHVPDEAFDMCGGINAGFGAGCMCAVLITGVMVFGLFFDDDTVKRLRLKLMDSFSEKFGSFNCCELRQGACCEKIIAETAETVCQLIDSNVGRVYTKSLNTILDK